MSKPVSNGTILITYEAHEGGELITGVTTTGDMPLVTQLGLLDLARDAILSEAGDD